MPPLAMSSETCATSWRGLCHNKWYMIPNKYLVILCWSLQTSTLETINRLCMNSIKHIKFINRSIEYSPRWEYCLVMSSDSVDNLAEKGLSYT